jgi:methylated-DNA-[protein]-cysteine S-methyltransferase
MQNYCFSYQSPVGILTITTVEEGVVSLKFNHNCPPLPYPINHFIKKEPHTLIPYEKEIISWLKGYFFNSYYPMDFPKYYPPKTPEFYLKIWNELSKTAPGITITYGELASLAGYDGAARAVGTAMAKNPLPIFVPCHRVVSISGIGGYTPGVDIKTFLLNLEKESSNTKPLF